jgi:hypothetical protein
MNTGRCRYCDAQLNPQGWCETHDLPGFRNTCPTIVLPPGSTVREVVFKKSSRSLSLEQAVAAKLLASEKSGNDLKLYFLHNTAEVVVVPEKVESNNQPEPESFLLRLIKGRT